ncbi:putative proteasome component (PCI) domain, winged helix DNA-binding domain superfamily [Helianthus annuus]|nr:putative proteasome component (PCI) domain, winged helix DNA-binding domain superfamily [Helianthus annuus]
MNLNVNSVDSLVTEIQGLSGSPQDVSHLNNLLKQSEDVIRSQAATFAPCLTRLDPAVHSLGYLYVLLLQFFNVCCLLGYLCVVEACTASPVPEAQANELILPVVRFIDVCSAEQIRLVPDKCIVLLSQHKSCGPLLTAIRKIQPSPEHLTPLHPDFSSVFLSAKCYKIGYSILEDDIYKVDQPRDFFLYCYYGGMICIGQNVLPKHWSFSTMCVVTAPMSSMNAIAVEAYKKYILVSLIHLRQFSSTFPKYTSSVAQRNLKNFSQPYIELANSYSTGNISELQAFVKQTKRNSRMGTCHMVIWVKRGDSHPQSIFDAWKQSWIGKAGCVIYVQEEHSRLTQTYLTLSLQDIANTAQINSPKEAEMHVLEMIEDGEIYATINQKDGMVGRERQRFDFDDFDNVSAKVQLMRDG